ncbi:Transcriptional activator protein acu-15 [Fulvia fulva]|nr:Transcriptional activator protein acu-15 [Fulvia fulva]KAK4614574.1 Transcriptional activator protein acu-15 [Fulvia fulva]WPV20018.1 Transcriptional activator protein acu-15 [Fulvia fulva]WPV35567.1 Transcriptional activator protein acu-15 [Fulvia fulva]
MRSFQPPWTHKIPLSSNHETGSLTQPSPAHESRFIGSSSGIYFINTVKQAFESSAQHSKPGHLPAAEDTVGGEDDYASSTRNSPERARGFDVSISSYRTIEVDNQAQLGTLPSHETAQANAISYFKTWHPVLPFLSGPEFLQELEALYSDPRTSSASCTIPVDRRRLCYVVIFQCVLSMGSYAQPPGLSDVPSRSSLLSIAAMLATRHDTLTIQTVLAAQLYCLSTMALRTASSLGVLLTKLLYHAGLHRCPYRYPQLSNEDLELRERILWASYALDRYVCQALGIPVSLSDAEIDVCVPGKREIHTVAHERVGATRQDEETKEQTKDAANVNKEVILANFVEHGRLVGRALEIFHSSLHSRNSDPRKVLFLRSDVDRWFNNLPEEPRLTTESSSADEQVARFLPFFHVLYEQLVISINRPSLSLPRNAPEFHHGLQVNIGAAKRTINALELQSTLFWPGYLASVWMSGLIISFACQVGLYNIAQGSQEILRCLDLLKRMGDRWQSARRCHAALSTLLSDLQRTQRRTNSEAFGDEDVYSILAKRRRLDSNIRSPPPHAVTSTPPTTSTGTTVQHNGAQPATMFTNSNGEWDVNDFFRDLSWNNLFDIGDAQHPDLQLFAG